MMADYYGARVNLNVLPRVAKKDVYPTNHVDVEKSLPMKVNIRQTSRFALLIAFATNDPKLTEELQSLYQACPNLFHSIMPNADDAAQMDLGDEADIIYDIHGSADKDHAHLVVRLHARKMSKVIHPASTGPAGGAGYQAEKGLPLRNRERSSAVSKLLREACARDYHFQVQSSGSSGLAGLQRIVGDYIQYHSTQVGRIDHIFLHDKMKERRIFLILTRLMSALGRDKELQQRVVRENKEDGPIIVGLPGLIPNHQYIVPVKNVGLVPIKWSVFTL
ncbi:hypothetical protein BFJ63_vAg16994 [Fusarium oxysporum f. sp. narcissi]|uniref:Uncharacterized protein n=1 Tax=Fusarium oxysporum f. sp. narcissi TaxID=451672 RepID=A0A4Q2V620_FUSOX|nr:hypothetical protein BFJ63_vAg16994 [Fusarium oxysporum f. sp. narcissi]